MAGLRLNPVDGLHLKKVVMEGMLQFLRVMMLSPEASSRKVILDLAYYWFMKHLNPRSLHQQRSAPSALQEIRRILADTRLPQALLDQELPS